MTLPVQLGATDALSEMDTLNEPLAEPFCAFLGHTIADATTHVRFLNLLSMLEHMGSRKIMLSQMKGILTQDILKHLAEETRHAFFFKREAEKLAKRPIEGYLAEETLCMAAGRFYFGKLDARLSATLPDKRHTELAYLWTSLVVELRALWVYRFYQRALVTAKYPMFLKSLIAEEDLHLESMIGRLGDLGFDAEAALPRAIALEKSLFDRLLKALTAQVPVQTPDLILAN
jgi:hypothetical protein